MIDQNIKDTLVNSIRAVVPPHGIFIFGSHATGTETQNSDLDLLVVLDNENLPNSYKERRDNFLTVSRALRDIERVMPIDLLVYTRQEFKMFAESGSLFSRRVMKELVALI